MPPGARGFSGLLTYKEAYEILNGAAVGFHGARGYSSEDDTRGTRSSRSVLRTSIRRARERVESRDELVQDVVERLTATRDSPHKDVSSDNGRKAGMSLRPGWIEEDLRLTQLKSTKSKGGSSKNRSGAI